MHAYSFVKGLRLELTQASTLRATMHEESLDTEKVLKHFWLIDFHGLIWSLTCENCIEIQHHWENYNSHLIAFHIRVHGGQGIYAGKPRYHEK